MRKVLKWIGIVLGGLVGLLVLILVGLMIYGEATFKTAQKDRPLYEIRADTSPEGVARGKYLLESVMGCAGACHSPQGGQPYTGTFEEIALGPAVLKFAPPNLTPHIETGLGSWSDAEIARAIREGVSRDGRALAMMPAFNYHIMSDEDIADVIGYLRSLPPTHNPIPEIDGNALGKALVSLELFLPAALGEPITTAQIAPPKGTVEYGAYLTSIAGCRDCHKPELTGGQVPPGGMIAPDITAGGDIGQWSSTDFLTAFRSGKLPEGRYLSPDMPYIEYGQMTDEDLLAIFSYLQSLPGKAAK